MRERSGDDGLPHQFARVYFELRRRAAALMRGERFWHTLSPTALVHEIYLRMRDGVAVECRTEQDVMALGAAEMRRVLTDYARRTLAQKRRRREDAAWPDSEPPQRVSPEELIDLHEALEELGAVDALAAKIVELRYYAGFSLEEAAVVLKMSPRSVSRRWQWARAMLRRSLEGERREAAEQQAAPGAACRRA